MTAKLVSIIGPPAAGKTTLAECLSAELPAELVREDYAGNPFLSDSYVGEDQVRLPSQVYFLMSRAKQLATSTWPREGLVVTDYGYCQDRVFARERLTENDFAAYRKIAGRVDPLVHAPDVVISLDASVDTLTGRIAQRGRPFETAMTPQFLTAMREAYTAVARALPCPVIHVDCDAVDPRDPSWRGELVGEIGRLLSEGGAA